MCSESLKRMENYYGELADIVRPSRSGDTSSEWQFPSYDDPMINYSVISDPPQDFGNPFANIKDPLLHDHHIEEAPVLSGVNQESTIGSKSDGISIKFAHKFIHDDDDGVMKKDSSSNNIFSRMLHISPSPKLPAEPSRDSPVIVTSPKVLVPNSGLVERPIPAMQISNPQNMGIKKRKNQTKKVMCIPAPAPANSRPSNGEIVPSDLWAWRKYGQKPIKGSPYPRGYYRCSSSKGCMARKQVERSRTDPNMLVITYTAEHNHPWPTQRNALAGSTRSSQHQATTTKTTATRKSSTSLDSMSSQKDKAHEEINKTTVVKDEVDDHDQSPLDIDGEDEGFPLSYRPELTESSNNSDDGFFAGLGEINEASDSLDFLLRSGDHDERENAGLDPFRLYCWPGNNNSTTTS